MEGLPKPDYGADSKARSEAIFFPHEIDWVYRHHPEVADWWKPGMPMPVCDGQRYFPHPDAPVVDA